MAQVKKKFIGDNEVGAAKVRLENDTFLRARNAANSGDVSIIKVTASDALSVTTGITFSGTVALPSGATVGGNNVATLDGGGKVPVSQLPSALMTFEGTWNASTNSPTLADGTGDAGQVYVVQTAGTRNLGSGSQTFAVGDWVIYNTSNVWQKVINSNAVASVNGATGVVVLSTTDIAEGTNLYYTAARFNTAFSGKSTTDLAEGSNLYFTNARAIAAPLTGYVSGAGTVSATDSILQAIQKLNGNISGAGAVDGKVSLTLNGTDITNQYKDMSVVIKASSLLLVVDGVVQNEGTDYTVSLTGGAGGNTRITFAGDLATGGAALVSGDILRLQYRV